MKPRHTAHCRQMCDPGCTALASSRCALSMAARILPNRAHKGKGLEFAHVFLAAWEEGTFPPTYGDLAEERRLAYVAITRGMRRVTISHCAYRRGHASPSRFLDDIPEQHRVLGWLRGPGPSARPPIRAPHGPAALLHRIQRQRRDLRS